MTETSPIFIGGFMRSGTTLLRYLLDSHPNISCGPETVRYIPELRSCFDRVMSAEAFRKALPNFLLNEDDVYRILAREPIASLLEPLRKHSGKSRWATKTPSNILHFDFLSRAFPDAYFIHVIRDGRDCVSSLENVEWWSNTLNNPVSFYNAARRWAEYVTTGRKHGQQLTRYLEVRYEDLTSDPRREMHKLLEFIGEEWDESILEHNKRRYTYEALVDPSNRAGAAKPIQKPTTNWKSKLSRRQTEIFCRVAGGLLEELGYEVPLDLPRGNDYRKKGRKAPMGLRLEFWKLKLIGKLGNVPP